MATVNKILSATSKFIGGIEKSKPMQWAEKKFNIKPDKALAAATVTSIVVKDGVGCSKYVTQSMNNDKIPEDKRKFVAALDLTNGVLMIAAQIAMFLAMQKYSGKLFNKLFQKSFNPEMSKNIASRIRMKQVQAGEPAARKLTIDKEFNKVKSDALDVFKFVLDIAAATIVGKRVIVPFIATPLASKVKEKMEAHSAKNHPEQVQTPEKIETPDIPPEAFGDKLDISTHNTNLLKRYYNYHR